jgi:hypothetical protein
MNVAYGSKLLAENYHYVHPFLYLSWSQKVQNSLNPEHKLTLDTILKKSTDLCKPVRWKLFDILVVTIFWIVSADSYDFIIFLSLINHRHEANCSCSKEAPWKNRFLHDDEDINGVIVFTEGTWNEAIIVRVDN